MPLMVGAGVRVVTRSGGMEEYVPVIVGAGGRVPVMCCPHGSGESCCSENMTRKIFTCCKPYGRCSGRVVAHWSEWILFHLCFSYTLFQL